MLVPPERVLEIGQLEPARLDQRFSERAKIVSWLDRLEIFLSDAQNTVEKRKEDLAWLRRVPYFNFQSFKKF